jgi:hypothetical protein
MVAPVLSWTRPAYFVPLTPNPNIIVQATPAVLVDVAGFAPYVDTLETSREPRFFHALNPAAPVPAGTLVTTIYIIRSGA